MSMSLGEKNVLVLGATGQIGYELANEMSRQNISTTVLVRKNDLTFPDNIKVIQEKTFSADVFDAALDGIDTVIYGIGLPEQFETSTELFQRVNVDILEMFLESLGRSSVKRMVYISTSEVFEVVDGVIRENHPHAEPEGFSAYFQSKIVAYRLATECAERMGIELTTIHPGAVYGGLNTSNGITNFIENLWNKRVMRVPFIMPTRFPIVHTRSLTQAILRSCDHPPQAFIVVEQMTSLKEIATSVGKQTSAYSPPVLPLVVATSAIKVVDMAAQLFNFTPIMSYSQLQLMTIGTEPKGDQAEAVLGLRRLSLDEGIALYLQDRRNGQPPQGTPVAKPASSSPVVASA